VCLGRYQMTPLNQGNFTPELVAKKVLDAVTIEVLKTSPKKLKVSTSPILSLGEAVQNLVRHGGFLARKGDENPGIFGGDGETSINDSNSWRLLLMGKSRP